MVEGVGLKKEKKTRSDKADVDDTQNESSGWWRESRALQVTTQLPLVSLLPPKEEEEEKKRQKAKVRYAGNRAAGKNVLDFPRCTCIYCA